MAYKPTKEQINQLTNDFFVSYLIDLFFQHKDLITRPDYLDDDYFDISSGQGSCSFKFVSKTGQSSDTQVSKKILDDLCSSLSSDETHWSYPLFEVANQCKQYFYNKEKELVFSSFIYF